jgi:hypothetical protein
MYFRKPALLILPIISDKKKVSSFIGKTLFVYLKQLQLTSYAKI